jgi:hypothetical protein
MNLNKRILFTFLPFILLAVVATGTAQSSGTSGDNAIGWTLYESFEGSLNSLGQVNRLDSTAGYNFNKYFGLDAGLPVYFVNASSSTSGTRSANALGDAYVDLKLTVKNPLVNYGSTLRGSVPTGDTNKGLSSGRATFDWTNHFDRKFGRVTPFANLGIANTVSDTRFFVRPFTTLGTVGHFEAGAEFELLPLLNFAASAYDVAPTGQQKIFSKLATQQMTTTITRGRVFTTAHETVGGADLASDNGFSVGFNSSPLPFLDLGINYTRSVHFRLDTLSYGVGVNVGYIVRKAKGK